LHNEELRNFYASPNIIKVIQPRKIRSAGHAACKIKKRNVHKILLVNPEGKRPLGRTRRRWEDIRWEGVDWMHLAHDRDQCLAVVNTVMYFRFPRKARDFLTH
jgi:hypothetical protein